MNTTPQTTTGIQTIPQERPPATPSRAAVSQYLGSRQARIASSPSTAPAPTQTTTNATTTKIQTNGIDIEISSIPQTAQALPTVTNKAAHAQLCTDKLATLLQYAAA